MSSIINTTDNEKHETHKLLIVDDDKLIHDLLSVSLDMAKVEIYHAYSGDEVYNILMNININCIFMDFVLPFSSGPKVTEIIRKAYVKDKIHIIGMTGTVGGEEERVCFESGMNAFIRKPFDSQELVDVFQKYIESVN